MRLPCQAKELNQVQLAKQLGVKKQSISHWENGNIMPSIDMLIGIADFFHAGTDYLLGREAKYARLWATAAESGLNFAARSLYSSASALRPSLL